MDIQPDQIPADTFPDRMPEADYISPEPIKVPFAVGLVLCLVLMAIAYAGLR
jgi:hypothetical protein